MMKLRRYTFLLLSAILIGSCSSASEQAAAKLVEGKSSEESVASKKRKKTILFFGDSITAGYQLEMDEAFPAIIQVWLDSLGYDYRSINAGLSGETTAGGKNRIDWVLRTVPDIFVLELGANDGLRGLPLEESEKNLQEIIDAVKLVNPEAQIVLAGMQVPPNLGQDYTGTFKKIFPKLAEKNDATLIPFILEGVAGIRDLNLEDGIHPTPEGHMILAGTVWEYLQPLLDQEPI